MKIHIIAVLSRIDFLKGWLGLAWAGRGPGGPWKLKVKIHIIAVLFRIDFLEGWPGLVWTVLGGVKAWAGLRDPKWRPGAPGGST